MFEKAFPKLDHNNISIKVERGQRYAARISAPASYVDDRPDFLGFWVISQMSMVLMQNPTTGGNFADRLLVDIWDGYLPRWPSPTTPPTELNYAQFHLSDIGEGILYLDPYLNSAQKMQIILTLDRKSVV